MSSLTSNESTLLNMVYEYHINFPFQSNDNEGVILTDEYTPEYVKDSNIYKQAKIESNGGNIIIPKSAFPVWLDNFETVSKLDNKDDEIIIAFLRVFNYWELDCKPIMDSISNYDFFIDVVSRNLRKIRYDWIVEFFDPMKLKGVRSINNAFLIWNYYSTPSYPENIERRFHRALLDNPRYFETVILLENSTIKGIIRDARLLRNYLGISQTFNYMLSSQFFNPDESIDDEIYPNFLTDTRIENYIVDLYKSETFKIIDTLGLDFEFYDREGKIQTIQKYLIGSFLDGNRYFEETFEELIPLLKEIINNVNKDIMVFILLYGIDNEEIVIEDSIQFNKTKSLLILFCIKNFGYIVPELLDDICSWVQLESEEFNDSITEDKMLVLLKDIKQSVYSNPLFRSDFLFY